MQGLEIQNNMKKYLIILLLLVPIATFAQIRIQPGVRGGVNISEIRGISGDKKTGFYLGGFLALNLGHFYTLQPEISYSNQGGKDVYRMTKIYGNDKKIYNDIATYEDLELEYLSLGIANKFYVTPGRDFHFIVATSFDGMIGDNIKTSVVAENGYRYDDYDDDITDVDLTLAFGVGYEFSFGLGVEARFKQGLVDILDDNFIFSSDGSSKNRVFKVGITYKFFNNKSLAKKN